eukprot:608490-Prymnesium_polylepis.1
MNAEMRAPSSSPCAVWRAARPARRSSPVRTSCLSASSCARWSAARAAPSRTTAAASAAAVVRRSCTSVMRRASCWRACSEASASA